MYPPWNAATQKRVAVTLARAPARISSICATLSFTSAFVASRCSSNGSPMDRPMTGRVLSSPAVYGCAGWSNTSYTSPVSSRRPAYMTATLSAICATTPKSWVMNSTESPYSSFSDISRSRICACIATSSRWSIRWHGSIRHVAIAALRELRHPLWERQPATVQGGDLGDHGEVSNGVAVHVACDM